MIEIPLGKVELGAGVEFSFPVSNCCNCGTRKGVAVVRQDTRRTSYFGLGGTEITFELPIPLCPGCVPSAKRRPKNLLHRALVFCVAFGVAVLGLMGVDELLYSIPALSRYLLQLSLLIALTVFGLMLLWSQPRGRQTSYYQPVRIRKLRREFVSGKVTGIRFFFSNRNYAELFARRNPAPVADSRVEVVS